MCVVSDRQGKRLQRHVETSCSVFIFWPNSCILRGVCEMAINTSPLKHAPNDRDRTLISLEQATFQGFFLQNGLKMLYYISSRIRALLDT